MKKLISFLCVAAMLLSVLPCAFADGEGITVAEGETLVLPNEGTPIDNNLSGCYASVDGSIVNNGTIEVDGSVVYEESGYHYTAITIQGDLSNNGEILDMNTDEGDEIRVSGTFTNNGLVAAGSEECDSFWCVVVDGRLENNGTIDVGSFVKAGVVENNGIIDGLVAGMNVNNNGTINGDVRGTDVNNNGTINADWIVAEVVENFGLSNGSIEAQFIGNAGGMFGDYIYAETVVNDGVIFAHVDYDADHTVNFNTIVVGIGEDQTAYYAVAKDENGEMYYYSFDMNGGLGVQGGDEITVNLANDGRDVLDSAWVFEGWETTSDDEDLNGLVFSNGEHTFVVNGKTSFQALWKYIEKMGWFVDDQVSKVMDAEGNEMVLGQDYYHVAFTSYNRYIVVFTNEQLQAMESGNHTFTIVLNDGTECTYTLGVE